MTMSLTEQLIMVGMVILGTMLTRFLPFLFFPVGRPTRSEEHTSELQSLA